jgi:uncharacterized membrane protein
MLAFFFITFVVIMFVGYQNGARRRAIKKKTGLSDSEIPTTVKEFALGGILLFILIGMFLIAVSILFPIVIPFIIFVTVVRALSWAFFG